MNYNYEKTQVILEGAELLYNMLQDLTTAINHLPGCQLTSNLKKAAATVGATSTDVFQTMKSIKADCEKQRDENIGNSDDDETDADDCGDVDEFLDILFGAIASGKPVSITADIYINDDSECEE